MARAQGARALMALAFETTYGMPPASGFTRMPFASTSLGAEQPLLNSELLGYGRDPLAPIKDAVTADGEVVVPLDAEAFGFLAEGGLRHAHDHGCGEAPYSHEFQSGSWTLPSMSIETGMPEVPRYAMYSGCVLDQITWQMQRSGLLTATARLVGAGRDDRDHDERGDAYGTGAEAFRPFQRVDHAQWHRARQRGFGRDHLRQQPRPDRDDPLGRPHRWRGPRPSPRSLAGSRSASPTRHW